MKSAKVQGFILDNDGLKKLVMNDPEPQLIPSLGVTEDKLDREFYKPIGNKLTLDIENKGYFYLFPFQTDLYKVFYRKVSPVHCERQEGKF